MPQPSVNNLWGLLRVGRVPLYLIMFCNCSHLDSTGRKVREFWCWSPPSLPPSLPTWVTWAWRISDFLGLYWVSDASPGLERIAVRRVVTRLTQSDTAASRDKENLGELNYKCSSDRNYLKLCPDLAATPSGRYIKGVTPWHSLGSYLFPQNGGEIFSMKSLLVMSLI